jgi:hypothetical protein
LDAETFESDKLIWCTGDGNACVLVWGLSVVWWAKTTLSIGLQVVVVIAFWLGTVETSAELVRSTLLAASRWSQS